MNAKQSASTQGLWLEILEILDSPECIRRDDVCGELVSFGASARCNL